MPPLNPRSTLINPMFTTPGAGYGGLPAGGSLGKMPTAAATGQLSAQLLITPLNAIAANTLRAANLLEIARGQNAVLMQRPAGPAAKPKADEEKGEKQGGFMDTLAAIPGQIGAVVGAFKQGVGLAVKALEIIPNALRGLAGLAGGQAPQLVEGTLSHLADVMGSMLMPAAVTAAGAVFSVAEALSGPMLSATMGVARSMEGLIKPIGAITAKLGLTGEKANDPLQRQFTEGRAKALADNVTGQTGALDIATNMGAIMAGPLGMLNRLVGIFDDADEATAKGPAVATKRGPQAPGPVQAPGLSAAGAGGLLAGLLADKGPGGRPATTLAPAPDQQKTGAQLMGENMALMARELRQQYAQKSGGPATQGSLAEVHKAAQLRIANVSPLEQKKLDFMRRQLEVLESMAAKMGGGQGESAPRSALTR